MFQGVMNKDQRRELGAHYTSEENILKLINPLFMDDLRAEFEQVKVNEKQLDRFHDRVGGVMGVMDTSKDFHLLNEPCQDRVLRVASN